MKHIKKFNEINNKEYSITEGIAFSANKNPYANEPWDIDRKESFRKKIEDHIKSLGGSVEQIGDDFEFIVNGKTMAEIMFREDYIGIKLPNAKFVDEFKYKEFGKIKQKITDAFKMAE
jgi:hypothetical protein